MRVITGALVLLTSGCGPGGFYSPERIAERVEAGRQQRATQAAAQAAYDNSATGKADLACKFRVNAAMSGWQSRSILDLEGAARSNMLHQQCMEYWRRTGQLP
jgi:hypothetical protein